MLIVGARMLNTGEEIKDSSVYVCMFYVSMFIECFMGVVPYIRMIL